MNQLCKLRVNQTVAQVNAVQKGTCWFKVCGNNGHSTAMCALNTESVMFVGNAQRPNYVNAYNQKWADSTTNSIMEQPTTIVSATTTSKHVGQ